MKQHDLKRVYVLPFSHLQVRMTESVASARQRRYRANSLSHAGPPTPDLCTHHISYTHLVFPAVPGDSSTDRLTAQRVLGAAEGPRADSAAWEGYFLKGMSHRILFFLGLRRVESILVNMHQTESWIADS